MTAQPDPWQVIADVMSELLRGGQTQDIRCRAALRVLADAGVDFEDGSVAAAARQPEAVTGSAQTAARAAYEEFWSLPETGAPDLKWDKEFPGLRKAWEAAAAAAQQPLRDALAALTARLDASAAATHPSRKSEVEREIAAALRQILEES